MNKFVWIAAILALLALCSVPTAAETQDVMKTETFVCDVCYFLVSWVEGKIASNKTESWIISEVDNICTVFPGFLGSECKSLVAYYVPHIINKLENKYTPWTICSDLGLCSWLKAQKAAAELAPSAGSRYGCAQCMFFSSMAYAATAGATDLLTATRRVGEMCTSMQDVTARGMCASFVVRRGFIQMLLDRKTPVVICTQLGDCHKRTADDVQLGKRMEKMFDYVLAHPLPLLSTTISGETGPLAPSSTECQLCQWIFSAYESWLSDGQTEAEIALFLSQLCNFFGSYAPQCNQLVRVYVPKVIQNYVERTTPPILCTSIGFCNFPINSFKAIDRH